MPHATARASLEPRASSREPLSLTGKRWQVLARSTPTDILGTITRQRSFTPQDFEEQPIENLVFPDREKIVDRIREAVESSEQIGIFGDYDCDGITGTAQLVRYFQRRGVTPLVKLPHRRCDGYGLKLETIETFRQAGTTLLLTIDTGVRAVREITEAQRGDIDVIVLDHHQLGPVLPPASGFLHPSLSDPPMSSPPCAAGLAFSLLTALEGEQWDGRDEDLILAMLGTVADMVELRGWNRSLVRAGMTALSEREGGPLALLRDLSGIDRLTLKCSDIAFRMAPRINAAGRMDDPMIALRALLGDSSALRRLQELNSLRQRETQRFLEESTEDILEGTAEASLDPFLFSTSENYPLGVIGLLAGKLTERFGRPVLIGSVQRQTCTCSLRSIRGYDITAALGRHQHLLTSFGGHSQAAGCTCLVSALPLLKTALSEDLRWRVQEEELVPTMTIDAPLEPQHISHALVEALRTLEPFGQGNPEPVFLLSEVTPENPRSIGKDRQHLQCTILGHKAVAFGLGHLREHCTQPLDAAFRLSINTWNGSREVQLLIEDIRKPIES